MKFELKLNKEQMAVIGRGAGKIGKSIVIEGTKAVVLKGAAAVITQGFDEGFGAVKDLNLDDVLAGGKKHNKPKEKKEGLFKKRKKTKQPVEEVVYEAEDIVEEAKETAEDIK